MLQQLLLLVDLHTLAGIVSRQCGHSSEKPLRFNPRFFPAPAEACDFVAGKFHADRGRLKEFEEVVFEAEEVVLLKRHIFAH